MNLFFAIVFIIASQIYFIYEGLTESSYRKNQGRYHIRRLIETAGIVIGWKMANILGWASVGVIPILHIPISDFDILLIGCLFTGHALYEAAFTLQRGGLINLWNKPKPYNLGSLAWDRSGYSRFLYAAFLLIGLYLITKAI